MKNLPRLLASISFIIGCVAAIVMFAWPVEVYIFEPVRAQTYYDPISLITSSDFNAWPYSKIDLSSRILPLIGTILLIAGIVLSIFYRNKRCIIASLILLIAAAVIIYAAKFILEGYSHMDPNDLSTYISVMTGYSMASLIPLSAILLIFAHDKSKKEDERTAD